MIGRYQGGCLCGDIRFAAVGPARNPHSCSCSVCQRHTGALTALWWSFPPTASSGPDRPARRRPIDPRTSPAAPSVRHAAARSAPATTPPSSRCSSHLRRHHLA
ncbi:GFA family protein [Ancylobacter defluvii]|uniref:GFA family protein n=1 Tax=Ancylobacter defluvii TaxID=1282440 RepID=UPI0040399630